MMKCFPCPHVHSAAEVAEILNCTERWLLSRVRNGSFPGRKIGGAIRFSHDDIDSILEACAVASPQSHLRVVPTFTR